MALKSTTFAAVAALAALVLAGCQTASTTKPVAEMIDPPTAAPGATASAPSATAAVASAKPDEKPKRRGPMPSADDDDPDRPLEKHEITAQCWMKIEKSRVGGGEAARTAAVDKCVTERLKTANVKR